MAPTTGNAEKDCGRVPETFDARTRAYLLLKASRARDLQEDEAEMPGVPNLFQLRLF